MEFIHYQTYQHLQVHIMAIRDGLSRLTPAEAAEAVGVGVQSIRRWCEWHATHLSVSASPGPGVPRRLTPRDVQVLITVKDLRYQGLQTEAINEKLAGMTFPEIDDPSPVAPESSLAMQEGQHSGPGLIVVVDDHETRLARVEASVLATEQAQRDNQKAYQDGMFRGALIMGLVMLGVFAVGLVLSWGR